MEQRRILSANADFQLAVSLLDNRKQRRRQRRFAVQSVTAIDQALAAGWGFDSLWSPAGKRLSAWAQGVLEQSGARLHVELAPELFAQFSGKSEPGELIALLELPADDLGRIPALAAPLIVVLDRPASPGNLGSIVRSAEAFGADAVLVTGHAADPYDPQAVRASVGALFALPVLTHGSPRQLAEALQARWPGLRIVGTSARGDTLLGDSDLRGPVALVLGNEATGLSEAWRELCDALVAIPIHGVVSSLNLAAAAAVVLAEAERQRD
ncbi:MAG: rRNA (uridine2479-2-O)-methyltransferase [Gaiellaceae bacterium]|nr:rRNA (uridine2479-2-O)-methyltransferase [Gaiellaceae bacterium]